MDRRYECRVAFGLDGSPVEVTRRMVLRARDARRAEEMAIRSMRPGPDWRVMESAVEPLDGPGGDR